MLLLSLLGLLLAAEESLTGLVGPQDELFEWHFTIAGPPDTAFEGGRFHGRIVMPPEYPMKPPDVYLSTPNGALFLGGTALFRALFRPLSVVFRGIHGVIGSFWSNRAR